MKKLLTLTLLAILLVFSCVSTSAQAAGSNILHFENVDIIFEEACALSDEAKQRVAEQLVYGEAPVATYGLMCTLFGHKTTTEIVDAVSHCVYSTAPRCVRETWQVVACSRCEHTEKTKVAREMIDCCP